MALVNPTEVHSTSTDYREGKLNAYLAGRWSHSQSPSHIQSIRELLFPGVRVGQK